MWPFWIGSSNNNSNATEDIIFDSINSTLDDALEGLVDVNDTILSPQDNNATDNYYEILVKHLESLVDSTQALLLSTRDLGRQVWHVYGGMDREEWRDTLLALWQQVQLEAIHGFDVLVAHPATLWLHQKTGVRQVVIVVTVLLYLLGFLLFISLGGLRKRTRKPRHNKRRKERSLSLSAAETNRGLRDRGFSLDLSVGNHSHQYQQQQQQLQSSSRGRRRLRTTLSFDFWNKNKATTVTASHTNLLGPGAAAVLRQQEGAGGGSSGSLGGGTRDRANSMDLLLASETDENALQHGIGLTVKGSSNIPGVIGSSTTTNNDRTMAAVARTQKVVKRVVSYHGPTENKLLYSTWTPPPSWTDASRALLPLDTRLKLQREISLDLSTHDECFMTIQEPPHRTAASSNANDSSSRNNNTPLTLPVAQCSVHVKGQSIGGVLEIYVKDSSKEEWMEHTFDSAKNAAQFQNDLVAIQIFGPALQRMYQALELIHQGSMACEGLEYVCHHDEMSDEVPQGIGVAWDDVMRAIGSNLPSLRVALERLWWHHYSTNNLRLRATRKRARKQQKRESGGNDGGDGGDGGVDSDDEPGAAATKDRRKDTTIPKHQNEYIHLTQDYVRRRLLLGPIDFFRLFVPRLPETALPRAESSKRRMEQLLRWRKRVATASLLVQGYVKARIIANKGWQLNRNLPTHYMSRRLAFDDNLDNTQRDATAKNEYYEGTVSRDVLTFVRPNEPDAFKPNEHWWQWRPRRLRTALSRYQAFSLVGHHIYKIPKDDDFPLNPQNDPVLTFGSLRELVEAHPDLDFFVVSFFPEQSKVAYVTVYVRSLSKGIDPAFDINWSRYKHGSKIIRDQKLSMMLQLGSSETKTWMEVAAITGMTYLMSTLAGDFDGGMPNADLGPSDRTPFPVVPLARIGETRHFGGALQVDRDLPQNYAAATIHLDTQHGRFNLISRLLLSVIEGGILAKYVFDTTIVLAANEQDELPERALGTMRPVRLTAKDIALPSIFVYESHSYYRTAIRRRTTQDATFFKSALGQFSLQPVTQFSQRMPGAAEESGEEGGSTRQRSVQSTQTNPQQALESFRTSTVATECPLQKSVNELIEVLDGVRISVRRDHLHLHGFASTVPMSLLEAHSVPGSDGCLHDKDLLSMSLLLLISRSEIERHFVASGCNLKKAAMRIVETAAWRGRTFPIDLRMCRIELQSGQFFQQGVDLSGRPVFYFRNMGLGPWRKDLDASVAALLHRLEVALREFSRKDQNVKCTLIVILGKPYRKLDFGFGDSASVAATDDGNDELGDSMNATAFHDAPEEKSNGLISNPRINPEETWQVQTNKKLIRRLIDLLSAHYPERLHHALVVIKPTHAATLRKLWGSYTMSSFVESPVTRSKVKLLSRFAELQKYVSKQELVIIAGGEEPIDPAVFGLEE